MYEALNSFLNVETWHTTHPNDDERFYRSLNEIVRNPDFNADAMGGYIREKVGQHYETRISELVTKAEAVSAYIRLGLAD